jgi:hypothetical protein
MNPLGSRQRYRETRHRGVRGRQVPALIGDSAMAPGHGFACPVPEVPICVIPLPAEHELLLARYVWTASSTSPDMTRLRIGLRPHRAGSVAGPSREGYAGECSSLRVSVPEDASSGFGDRHR